MVVLSRKSFSMGSLNGKDEAPVHTVTFTEPFAVSLYEITFSEYDRFCKATSRSQPNDRGWGRGNRPVVNVSWEDAYAYTRWLSKETGHTYRLPSEAEWEYAARGKSNTAYWWGAQMVNGKASCDGCGSLYDNDKTAPVGTFKPNGFGLYDTAGNVWEWCSDSYHKNYQGAPANGRSWSGDNSRIFRGGSYRTPTDSLRSSYRNYGARNYSSDDLGFRVVRVVQ